MRPRPVVAGCHRRGSDRRRPQRLPSPRLRTGTRPGARTPHGYRHRRCRERRRQGRQERDRLRHLPPRHWLDGSLRRDRRGEPPHPSPGRDQPVVQDAGDRTGRRPSRDVRRETWCSSRDDPTRSTRGLAESEPNPPTHRARCSDRPPVSARRAAAEAGRERCRPVAPRCAAGCSNRSMASSTSAREPRPRQCRSSRPAAERFATAATARPSSGRPRPPILRSTRRSQQRSTRRAGSTGGCDDCLAVFAEADLNKCVSCGLCLGACTTFRATGLETASPRGRIEAMRAVADGSTSIADPTFGRLMDECVQCRACEAVCPSGAPFGLLMEQARVGAARGSAFASDAAGRLGDRLSASCFATAFLLVLASVVVAVLQLLRIKLPLSRVRLRDVLKPLRAGRGDQQVWFFRGMCHGCLAASRAPGDGRRARPSRARHPMAVEGPVLRRAPPTPGPAGRGEAVRPAGDRRVPRRRSHRRRTAPDAAPR